MLTSRSVGLIVDIRCRIRGIEWGEERNWQAVSYTVRMSENYLIAPFEKEPTIPLPLPAKSLS
jgi:hypothetical protein